MTTHYVYECYDASGALLYVGLTTSPSHRMANHRNRAPWASQVERVEVHAVGPDRREAARVERQTIRSKRPLYNIDGTEVPQRAPGSGRSTSMQHLATVLLGRPVDEFIHEGRQNGKTWRELAAELSAVLHPHRVSYESLRTWFPESRVRAIPAKRAGAA